MLPDVVGIIEQATAIREAISQYQFNRLARFRYIVRNCDVEIMISGVLWLECSDHNTDRLESHIGILVATNLSVDADLSKLLYCGDLLLVDF